MTPLYPEFHKVKLLMKAIDGVSSETFQTMWDTIWGLRGTPQNPMDWKKPDEWIPERLSGKTKALAERIWENSGKIVNPRHVWGPKFLIDGYNLLNFDEPTIQLTEKGRDFLTGDINEISKEIDLEEGCIFILYLLSVHGEGKRGTFYDEWKDFLLENTNYKEHSVVNDSLSRRLRNLNKRDLIHRKGNKYSISTLGEKYLKQFDKQGSLASLSEESELGKAVEKFNHEQRKALLDLLSDMNPFQFEGLIKELLVEMGYEDVIVTSPTNDKGVDVVGTMQKGITSVKEVVQVKRNTTANVQRQVLDALRGSLHRFGAFQGTIITIYGFSKGTQEAAFEPGAAPITLIDGEKLLDLLIEYGIGVKKKKIEYYVVNSSFFEESLEVPED